MISYDSTTLVVVGATTISSTSTYVQCSSYVVVLTAFLGAFGAGSSSYGWWCDSVTGCVTISIRLSCCLVCLVKSVARIKVLYSY